MKHAISFEPVTVAKLGVVLVVRAIFDKGSFDIVRHLALFNLLNLIFNLFMNRCEIAFLEKRLFIIGIIFIPSN